MQTLTARFDGRALVPDGPLDLDVGETVEVSIRRGARNGRARPRPQTRRPAAGTVAAILPHVGTWAGERDEMDQLLGELRRTKQAEVAAKKAALARESRGAKAGGARRKSRTTQRKRRA